MISLFARFSARLLAGAVVLPLVSAAPAVAAVSQPQAERAAISALKLGTGNEPVVLFRQLSVVPSGTAITQAGATASTRASRAAVSRDRALRDAGVKIIKAPLVVRPKEAVWFFYEDQAPYQAFEHPGRVVLVGRTSGKVTITKSLSWPPLIGGKLPRALSDYASYRASKYRAFARSWVLDESAAQTQTQDAVRAVRQKNVTKPTLPSTLADSPAAKASQREAARLLAAEKSCAIRISDSLGDFYDAGPVDNTRAALGLLFHNLSVLDPGFFTDRYRYRDLAGGGAGITPMQFVTNAIKTKGCQDILVYIAGGGTTVGGEPAVNIGTKTRKGGKIETQSITASALKALITSTPQVTFKVEVDAPRSGAFLDAVGAAPNLLFAASSSTGSEGSFTALDDVVDPSGAPSENTYNSSGLLEFTNRQLKGLGCFLSSADEVSAGARAKAQGRSRSFFAWMLARSLSICGRGYLPQVVQNASVPKLTLTFPKPTDADLNQAPTSSGSTLTADEDTPLPLVLTGTDSDGDALTFKIVVPPTSGTLTGGTGAARTYTPNAEFSGEDRFTFTVSDGKETSAPATVVITVKPLDDAPVLKLGDAPSTFTEAGPPVAVDGSITVTDVDDTRLNGATVEIKAGFASGQDELLFTNQNGITGTYAAATGRLSLTGDASVADYQAALRSIRFTNPSSTLSGTTRQILFFADDGDATGVSPARAVSITVVNDAPVLTGGGTTAAYTEDDVIGVPVGPALDVSDVDNLALQSATVQITGGLDSTEDELVFTDQSGITGTYAAGSGMLTLTGAASLADYEAALQSIAYRNLDTAAPSIAARTITVQVNDGALDSGVQTLTVTVARVNDAPVLTTGSGTPTFTEGGAPVAVAPAATALDVDDANLTGATVLLVSGFDASQDLLAFTNTPSITGSYNAGTGVLTLTGTATVAAYQAALRTITYENTSANPSGVSRSVSFTATDGADVSGSVSQTVTVVPINDAPVLAGGPAAATFTEDDATGAIIHSALTVSDVDDSSLVGATVAITTGRVDSEDRLVFVDQNGIVGSYNPGAGVLTLTGIATLAEYQSALRSVRYRNLNTADPSTTARGVEFVVDDGASTDNLSNILASSVSVSAVNDAPTVATSGANPTFTEGGSPVIADPAVLLADADNANLAVATVSITTGFDATEDVLALPVTPGLGSIYNAGTGVLTITGVATKAVYQAALRTVTYANTNGAAPNTAARTLSFVVDDGEAANHASAAATGTVQVAPINDAPVLAGGSNTVTFNEDDATGVVVNGAITASDVDSPTLAGATVQVTSNFVTTEDELVFTNQGGISGAYSAATGVLTLTGTASVATYQTALRSIRYRNTNTANPTTAQRVVTFAVTDGAATSNTSNSVVTNVDVTPADDAPTAVAGAGAAATFTEGGSDVVIDAGITVADPDSANLASATVQISGGLVSAEDRLVFSDTAAITGVYTNATGLLTLTGSDTVANYQAALRSVQYRNLNTSDPSGAARTVSFVVSDGALTSSPAATKTVNVSPVNDAPVLTATAGSAAFVENAGPVAVDPTVSLADVDNATFSGATAQITGNHQSAQDVLAFVDTPNITGSWNSGTGTLTLTGSDTLAAYQAALRTITYANTSDTPNTTARTVTFAISDSAPAQATATRGVTVQATNDRPVVTAGGGSPTYTESGLAVTVDPSITATDPDGDQITGATACVCGNWQPAEDELVYTTTNGITGSYNAGSGVLTLSGAATASDYQGALRAVKYQNTSTSPSTLDRSIDFAISDASLTSFTAATTVHIASNNTAPVLAGGGNTLAYTEDDAASVINAAITASDSDDANLEGAVVTITGNADPEDALAFATIGPISGSYNSGTSTLTLTGTDTVANYQAALRTVTYVNNDHSAPSSLSRTVGFTVNDGEANSNAVTSTITIAQSPDAPVLVAGTGNTNTFTEGGSAVLVDDAITVSDADSASLVSASAAITTGFSSAQGDTLASTTVGSVTGSYNAATGVLSLTGSGTLAEYQTALRSVRFSNTSDAPTASRTISFTASDAALTSTAVTHAVSITGVNDAPVLGAGGTLSYTENDPATAISTGLTLTDADSSTITGATVTIGTGFVSAEDTLSFTNAPPITGSYNGTTGVLTLSGSDTLANYQAALRSVKYANTSEDPDATQRTVTFSATDNGAPGLTGSITATINVTPVNDAPSVTGEADTAVGNTRLAYGTAVPTGRAGHTRAAVTVLTNDSDVDGPAAPVVDVATSSATSSNGGAVTWNADGTFSYDPPAGFTGVDTLTYKVVDGAAIPNPGTGTVSVTVSGRVWYVDNSVADGGDGRSTLPFDTLAEADVAANAVNDRIYVHEGNATATKLTTNVALMSGQQLIGEAQDLVVGAETLFDSAPADRPVMAGTVAVDDGNTIKGLRITTTGTNAIEGATGDVAGTLDDLVLAPAGAGGAGLSLNTTTGTWNVSNTAITHSGGAQGINVTSAGTVNFAAAGTISVVGAGPGITIAGTTTSGTIDETTVTSSATTGIAMSNTAGSLTLDDVNLTTTGVGLELDSTNGVTVQTQVGASGDITSAATALDVNTDTNNTAITQPTVALDTVTSTAGTVGVRVDDIGAGTVSVTGTGSLLNGHTSAELSVAGGSGNVTYAGSIGDATTDGSGLSAQISGRTGGTVSVSGTIADTADAGGGISMTGNSGGTTNFSGTSKVMNTGTSTAVSLAFTGAHAVNFTGGGLAITAGSGSGFIASGTSGTLSVQGTGNTVTTSTGSAIDISGPDIAAADATFQSVSSNGASTGVNLSDTGAAGGLHITGTGGVASGGTIQNSTGAGVVLNNTSDVQLGSVRVQTGGDDGIRGTNVSGFSLTALAQVINNGNAVTERGLDFTELSGTATFTGATVTGNMDDNLAIVNDAATLSNVTVDGGTYSSNSTTLGNDGIRIENNGAGNTTGAIRNAAFTNNRGDHIQVVTDNSNTSTQNLTIEDNTFRGTGNQGGNTMLGGGVAIGAGGNTNQTVVLDQNDIERPYGSAISLNLLGNAVGKWTVTNNAVGTTAEALSGSQSNSAVYWNVIGNGTATTRIANNTFLNSAFTAIDMVSNDGDATVNATIQGNTISEPGPMATYTYGLRFVLGSDTIDNGDGCLDLGSSTPALKNSLSTSGVSPFQDIRLRAAGDDNDLQLVGYAGTSHDNAAVNAYLVARNDGNGTPDAAVSQVDNINSEWLPAASCPLP